MRTNFLTGGIAILAAAFSVTAHAQVVPPPHFPPVVYTEYNALANPGFELNLAGWDRSGSAASSQDGVPATPNPNLVGISNITHTGNVSALFQPGGTDFGPFHVAVIRQVLSTPLPGNAVWQAYVWAYNTTSPSAVNQASTLHVEIEYTDGTTYQRPYAIAPNQAGQPKAWQLIDFHTIINESKTIKAIDFFFWNGSVNTLLDDAALNYLAIKKNP